MQSNDVRTLLNCAVPAAVVGGVAVAVSGMVAGGKGALGAGFGALLVIAFMGVGLVVLQRTAKHLPQLFQAMGLVLYTTQLLLLAVVLALFKHTTLFDLKAFAFTVVAVTLAWVAGQTRAHLKARVFYVDPEPSEPKRSAPVNSSS